MPEHGKFIPPQDVTLPQEEMGPFPLERTARFIATLKEELEAGENFSQFETPRLDYRDSYDAVAEHYTLQAAVMLALAQPDLGTSNMGFLNPDSLILVTQRSEARAWGAGTWSVPMGRIEEKDKKNSRASLGDVIRNAAYRELGEEVVIDARERFHYIAGSFLDTKTGFLIHMVVDELLANDDNTSSMKVSLPDVREHSQAGWLRLKEFPQLSPVEAGLKFGIITALNFIDEQNHKAFLSGRFF